MIDFNKTLNFESFEIAKQQENKKDKSVQKGTLLQLKINQLIPASKQKSLIIFASRVLTCPRPENLIGSSKHESSI